MDEIFQLIKDLDWNNLERVQQNAITELSKLKGDDVILLAKQSNELCSKSCWDNAAVVLENIGYPNNKASLPYLMEWFQDINWPGVRPIIAALNDIDIKVLIPHIENASNRATTENDECWANGLIYLIKELNISIENFNNVKIIGELEKIANR